MRIHRWPFAGMTMYLILTEHTDGSVTCSIMAV